MDKKGERPEPAPAHAEDFDAAMRRAGIHVPEAWRAGTLAVHEGLSRAAALLHAPLDPADWPANAFLIETVSRRKR